MGITVPRMTPLQKVEAEWHQQKIDMWATDLEGILEELEGILEEIEEEHKRLKSDPETFILAKGHLAESASLLHEYFDELEDIHG